MVILFPYQADLVIYTKFLVATLPLSWKTFLSFLCFLSFLSQFTLKKYPPGLDFLHLHTNNERGEIFFLKYRGQDGKCNL